MAYKEKNKDEIEMNERLVKSVAKRFLHSGYSIEELESFGKKGLELARKKYDPSRGFRFICSVDIIRGFLAHDESKMAFLWLSF